MSGYMVKEIFKTLQGEGRHTGRAAVFVRFAGCNLWNGREDGRHLGIGGCARWCDTDFRGGDRMDTEEILEAVMLAWAHESPPFVVLTGGEPLLQIDDLLVSALRSIDAFVAVETNGTKALPLGLDWITLSPKAGAPVVCGRVSELKLVYPQDGLDPAEFERFPAQAFFIQPKDEPDGPGNTARAIAYCLDHPKWRLSLQTHKLVGLR